MGCLAILQRPAAGHRARTLISRFRHRAGPSLQLAILRPALTRSALQGPIRSALEGQLRMGTRISLCLAALLLSSYGNACDLRVSDGWIREPTPGATILAGYARLLNSGAAALVIASVRSSAFTRVEMHESVQRDGVMQMRPLPSVTVAPAATVRFEPDGKHFMLIGPARTLARGDHVSIEFTDSAGCVTAAQFNVGAPRSTSASPASSGSGMPAGMAMGSTK